MEFYYNNESGYVMAYEGKFCVAMLNIYDDMLEVQDDKPWSDEEKDRVIILMRQEYEQWLKEQDYDISEEQGY